MNNILQIPTFTIKDYKERIPNLYPPLLAEECSVVTNAIENSGSVVGDNLMIWDNTVEVSDTISDAAIRTVCAELLGYYPTDKILSVGNGKKTFILGKKE